MMIGKSLLQMELVKTVLILQGNKDLEEDAVLIFVMIVKCLLSMEHANSALFILELKVRKVKSVAQINAMNCRS